MDLVRRNSVLVEEIQVTEYVPYLSIRTKNQETSFFPLVKVVALPTSQHYFLQWSLFLAPSKLSAITKYALERGYDGDRLYTQPDI